jgi:hypothetical protein
MSAHTLNGRAGHNTKQTQITARVGAGSGDVGENKPGGGPSEHCTIWCAKWNVLCLGLVDWAEEWNFANSILHFIGTTSCGHKSCGQTFTNVQPTTNNILHSIGTTSCGHMFASCGQKVHQPATELRTHTFTRCGQKFTNSPSTTLCPSWAERVADTQVHHLRAEVDQPTTNTSFHSIIAKRCGHNRLPAVDKHVYTNPNNSLHSNVANSGR